MGHVVEHCKVKPDPTKLKAIRQLQPPENVKELRAFLGLVGFYRRFVRGFAKKAKVLCELLKGGERWNWTEEH